jgi:hypothetical protein
MALFNKKKNEVNQLPEIPDVPSLPPLPKLPELDSDNSQFRPNALPRFPPSSFGEKFSQSTIKDAISGEREGDESANESEEVQTMPKLPEGPLTRDVSSPEDFVSGRRPRPAPRNYSDRNGPQPHPMFVRLDKFEENLEVFERIKKQLSGVEKILEEITRTREQEDKEMQDWQSRLQTMKEQLDKIDQDIFSNAE